MIFLSILSLIVALALPGLKENFGALLLIRISSLVFIFSSLLSFNVYYLNEINTGIGIYSGLFHVNAINQLFEIFLLIVGSLILFAMHSEKTGVETKIEDKTNEKSVEKYEIETIIFISILSLIAALALTGLNEFFMGETTLLIFILILILISQMVLLLLYFTHISFDAKLVVNFLSYQAILIFLTAIILHLFLFIDIHMSCYIYEDDLNFILDSNLFYFFLSLLIYISGMSFVYDLLLRNQFVYLLINKPIVFASYTPDNIFLDLNLSCKETFFFRIFIFFFKMLLGIILVLLSPDTLIHLDSPSPEPLDVIETPQQETGIVPIQAPQQETGIVPIQAPQQEIDIVPIQENRSIVAAREWLMPKDELGSVNPGLSLREPPVLDEEDNISEPDLDVSKLGTREHETMPFDSTILYTPESRHFDTMVSVRLNRNGVITLFKLVKFLEMNCDGYPNEIVMGEDYFSARSRGIEAERQWLFEGLARRARIISAIKAVYYNKYR